MSKRPASARGGVGLVLMASVLIAGVGVALDFAVNGIGGFWLADEPGFRALIGAAAALVAVLLAHLVRAALWRKDASPEEIDADQP